MSRAKWWNLIVVGLAAFWALVIVGGAYAFASASLGSPIPPGFDHVPAKQVIVVLVNQGDTLLSWCGRLLPSEQEAVSCAALGVNQPLCVIYISTELSPHDRGAALRHERANCNGWNDGKEQR